MMPRERPMAGITAGSSRGVVGAGCRTGVAVARTSIPGARRSAWSGPRPPGTVSSSETSVSTRMPKLLRSVDR